MSDNVDLKIQDMILFVQLKNRRDLKFKDIKNIADSLKITVNRDIGMKYISDINNNKNPLDSFVDLMNSIKPKRGGGRKAKQ